MKLYDEKQERLVSNMSNLDKKILNQNLRKGRVRAKVSGTSERPRLSVSFSNIHISAQLIDDVKQHTIASATTVGAKLTGTTTDKAAIIGTEIGKKAKKAKVTTVVFDRNSHKYAKRLSALANAARMEGLKF